MTLEEAQKEVDRWIKTYGVRYFSELTNMAVLTEEVGELARIMARKYGDQSFKEGEKMQPCRRDGRCALGTPLPRQPDRCRPDGSLSSESRKENKPRQRQT